MKTLREYIDLVDEELADETSVEEEVVEENNEAADEVIALSNELNNR